LRLLDAFGTINVLRGLPVAAREPGGLMAKHPSSQAFLRFIIFEKSFIGLLSISLAIGILSLTDKDLVSVGHRLVALLNLDTDNAYITLALEKLGLVSNKMIVGISIGGFAYAVLNLVEAYGLHRRLRWAEWLTVVATGLLIPFEIYEVVHHLSPVRVWALVLNVAIVIYLAKHKELFPRWF
jgi:uncharacterized membrane protein (DUF2068 family)